MYRQTPSHRNQEATLRPPKAPDRPLVPYMRFSKKMWPKVRAENPDRPLWDLGKVIGQLWNTAPAAEKSIYQQEYEADKAEYEKAMKSYNAAYAQYMAAKSRVKGAPQQQQEKASTSSSARKGMTAENQVTGVFIQPVDDEDPFEMTGKRMAAIRFDRNNRLMAELFSANYMPDPRTFVPQQRIDHFRRQGQSLEQHQNKLNEELTKLEEQFIQRKRAIEEASKEYVENMKRVCLDKPQLDQDHLNKIADEYGEQLVNSWKAYEERQAAIQAKLEAERRANPVLSNLITSKSPTQEVATESAVEVNGIGEETTQITPSQDEEGRNNAADESANEPETET